MAEDAVCPFLAHADSDSQRAPLAELKGDLELLGWLEAERSGPSPASSLGQPVGRHHQLARVCQPASGERPSGIHDCSWLVAFGCLRLLLGGMPPRIKAAHLCGLIPQPAR